MECGSPKYTAREEVVADVRELRENSAKVLETRMGVSSEHYFDLNPCLMKDLRDP